MGKSMNKLMHNMTNTQSVCISLLATMLAIDKTFLHHYVTGFTIHQQLIEKKDNNLSGSKTV